MLESNITNYIVSIYDKANIYMAIDYTYNRKYKRKLVFRKTNFLDEKFNYKSHM